MFGNSHSTSTQGCTVPADKLLEQKSETSADMIRLANRGETNLQAQMPNISDTSIMTRHELELFLGFWAAL